MTAVRTASWVPPPDFRPARSLVDGITVFAPVPEEERTPAVVDARCPACGGAMAFDPAKGALTCGFCGHTESRSGGGAATSHDFTLEAIARAAHGWGTDRKLLHCDACGTSISIETGMLARSCPYCASNRVELVADDPNALRPGAVLPFLLRADDLVPKVNAWLGRGWMHPGDLAALARVDAFVGVYVPYWLFDAHVESDWEAEVGEERTETYHDHEGRLRTRTVIDWSWRSGHVVRDVRGVRVAGTARLSNAILGRVQKSFDLAAVGPYDPTVLAGFQAQSYDRGLPEAWDLGRTEIREIARAACMADTGSHHVRNFTMTAALSDESWRYALLPVWVSAYRFRDRAWQVMVNGQSGAIEGQKPVVWWRVYAAMVALVLPAVCSGVVGVPLLLAAGAGAVLLVLALILLIVGGIGAGAIWRRAVASEEA